MSDNQPTYEQLQKVTPIILAGIAVTIVFLIGLAFYLEPLEGFAFNPVPLAMIPMEIGLAVFFIVRLKKAKEAHYRGRSQFGQRPR